MSKSTRSAKSTTSSTKSTSSSAKSSASSAKSSASSAKSSASSEKSSASSAKSSASSAKSSTSPAKSSTSPPKSSTSPAKSSISSPTKTPASSSTSPMPAASTATTATTEKTSTDSSPTPSTMTAPEIKEETSSRPIEDVRARELRHSYSQQKHRKEAAKRGVDLEGKDASHRIDTELYLGLGRTIPNFNPTKEEMKADTKILATQLRMTSHERNILERDSNRKITRMAEGDTTVRLTRQLANTIQVKLNALDRIEKAGDMTPTLAAVQNSLKQMIAPPPALPEPTRTSHKPKPTEPEKEQ